MAEVTARFSTSCPTEVLASRLAHALCERHGSWIAHCLRVDMVEVAKCPLQGRMPTREGAECHGVTDLMGTRVIITRDKSRFVVTSAKRLL